MVVSPRMTSTSFMAGGGLKKCRPSTRPGCAAAGAMASIDRLEVLVARIVVAGWVRPSSSKSADLASRSSAIASMTTMQAGRWVAAATGVIRAAMAAASSAVIRPWAARLARSAAIRVWARSAAPSNASQRNTG
ncbi:MAG: hypothetical protein BWY91_01664 [bacterium ADurb.BinA028]|nr:MAG: hypothetical protein BWY91_01664 [bacterium ADurb.BinA028]